MAYVQYSQKEERGGARLDWSTFKFMPVDVISKDMYMYIYFNCRAEDG